MTEEDEEFNRIEREAAMRKETVKEHMTQDEIIRMAEECGIPEFENNESQAENIIRFAALVAAAEREACAKVCDAVAQQMDDEGEGPTGYIGWVGKCADAIRARGQA